MNTDNFSSSRRVFLKNSAALAGATLLGTHAVGASAHLTGSDRLKLALIGCGSRGAGAVVNALRADKHVQLVAMADAFADQLAATHNTLLKIPDIKNAVKVPESHMFVGFEGYKEAIALADVDRKSTRLNSSHVKISYAV